MNERRRERLAAYIKEIMPEFFAVHIEHGSDIFLSVLYVEVVASGTKANVFVSVYPDTAREGIAEKLKMSENIATRFVRTHLGSKYSPAIRFFVH